MPCASKPRCELVFLAAAEVLDLERFAAARSAAGHAKARAGRDARDVLHAHRLARAEQRAIENGVDRDRRAPALFGAAG